MERDLSRRSALGVQAIARLRRMVAHADCLSASAALAQAEQLEQRAEQSRDMALEVWRTVLASDLLPPEQIRSAQGWVLACHNDWLAASLATTAANDGLQRALEVFGVAQGHEDVTKVLSRRIERAIARQAEDKADRSNEDRVLQGQVR